MPEKIVKIEGNINNAESLLIEKPLQIGLNEKDFTIFQGKSFIILDFGKEYHDGIRISTFFADNDCEIRIRFGESLMFIKVNLGDKITGKPFYI